MLPDAATTTGCRNAEDALPPTAVSSVSSIGSICSMRCVVCVIVSRACVSSESTHSTTGISTSMKQTLRPSALTAPPSAASVCVTRLANSTGSMTASISAPSRAA